MKYKHKEVEQFHFIGMVIYLLYDILQDFFFFFLLLFGFTQDRKFTRSGCFFEY